MSKNRAKAVQDPRNVQATQLGVSAVEGYEHQYARVNEGRPKELWDYQNYKVEWSGVEPYVLHRKIGRGKYSEVFTATNRFNGVPCVVKVLKPVKEQRLAREILVLQNLCGVPNVITLYDLVMDVESGVPAYVFEFVRNQDARELYPTFTGDDLRYYQYHLIKSLEISHGMGIMHRDVKPQNIVIDHAQRKLRLIDWGLAEFYHLGQQYNVRVASRHYKGPELLVGFRKYDYSLDMWSVGCCIAAIIFKKDPFFYGHDNEDQLLKIMQVLGSEAVVDYVNKLKLPIQNIPEDFLAKEIPRKPWSSFISSNTLLATPDAIDLVDKLLVIDHTKRLTAQQALDHPFFNTVRVQCELTITSMAVNNSHSQESLPVAATGAASTSQSASPAE